jgi:hypothetical protein
MNTKRFGRANSGERTRPRVLFAAPSRQNFSLSPTQWAVGPGKVRDGEGALASTRGRVRSPE